MVEYYKEKNMTFKLKDLNVVEDFKLWIGWKQQLTDEEMIAQYGVVLQFPVKEGQLQGKDSVPRDVQTVIKFMKRAEFDVQYPKLGKKTQYTRNILIGDVEYRYGFSKTSNDKLNAMLALSPGTIPNVLFKQSFDLNKPAAQMYDITVATAEEANAPVTNPQPVQNVNQTQPVPTNSVPPQVVSPQSPSAPVSNPSGALSDGEKTILTSVKGLHNKLDKEKFIKVFTQNLMKPEFGGLDAGNSAQRALVIFEQHYQ